jgi:predicted nucleic acid-binding protein
MYAAVLDANVLVPSALCDTLLRLAAEGFYRPLWSEQILTEVEHAILLVRPELEPTRVSRRIDAMRTAFIDANVDGWQEVAAGLDLPDPDDRHVVAAAIAGGAQAIVTFNVKDFPEDRLAPRGIEARHPDAFLLDQLDLSPSSMLEILVSQAADLLQPPMDLAGLLNNLARCHLPGFVEAARRLAPENL